MTRLSISPTPSNACLECGAAPIPDDALFCNVECSRAARHRCVVCDSLVINPEKHYRNNHPDTQPPKFILTSTEGVPKSDEPATLEPEGPVMFGEVEEQLGQRLDGTKRWECDDCGEPQSKAYARTFAQEDGTLYCANCRSRTDRYSNDPVIDRYDS